MSEHAKLSPSGSARWLACPGSYWLSEQAPKQPSSAAADEGTDAHEWAAKMLYGDDGFDNPYSGIELYVDRVKATAERKGAVLWVEKRVYLTEQIHGTPDAVIAHKKTVDVFDLKYGYNKVEAKDNSQLLIYAAGAIKTYDLKPTTVNMHIVQPRAGGIRSASMPVKLFWARVNAITEAADNLLANPEAPRRAGDHCQYCPAAPICPERKAEAQAAAAVASAVLRKSTRTQCFGQSKTKSESSIGSSNSTPTHSTNRHVDTQWCRVKVAEFGAPTSKCQWC